MTPRFLIAVVLVALSVNLEIRAQGETRSAEARRVREALADDRPGVDAESDDELRRSIEDLGDMVVVAARREVEVFFTPATVERLGAFDVHQRLAATSFPDALRELTGVQIQKTGPGLASPFLRGLTGFRTVALIDGVRLNHAALRDGPNQYWNTIDALALDRIEVVKGPSSVLWGSDAIGGSIAAFTESLDYGTRDASPTFGGRAYYRFGLADTSHVGRVSFHVGHDDTFAARVGITYRDHGDIDAGGGFSEQPGTGYTADNVDFKLGFKLHEKARIELTVQTVNLNNVPRTHSTVDGVSFHGTTIGSDRRRDFDQERDLVLLTAFLDDGPFYDRAELRLGWHRHEEIQDRIRSSGRRDLTGFRIESLIVGSQFEKSTRIGDMVFGAELQVEFVDSFRSRFEPSSGVTTTFVQGPIADNSTYLTLGVFAQNTIDLGAVGELTLGVRFTHVDVEADRVAVPGTSGVSSLEDDFQSIVGSLRLLTPINDVLNVYAGVGLGFRAPNLSDLTRFDAARSNELEIPAPGLDPEQFLGFELGAKLATGRVTAELAGFYTELFDTIIRRPTGTSIDDELVVTKDNVGDGHILGVEFRGAWDFCDDFTAWGNFTWIDGVVDTFPTADPVIEREAITRLQPITARGGIVWQPAETGFRAEFAVDVVAGQDRLNTRDRGDTQRIPPGGTPGYTLYHLRFAYDLCEERSVFLNLENLGDKNYRIHGSGSQEPGFNAVLGFDFRF